MVRRGRAGRGRTVGVSLVVGEGKLTPLNAEEAAEAVERPESSTEGVSHWGGSQSSLPAEGGLDIEADGNKRGAGEVEVVRPDSDI